jgi:hypothetical protein
MTTCEPREKADYLDLDGDQLYYVAHPVPAPKSLALLAGPFVTERPYSYTPWVRWARYLTQKGHAAVRFDYRGVGESSGEKVSFAKWIEDILFMANWIKKQYPGVPLTMHGLGLGGLLASQAFARGCGDALLLWSAPATGEEALREGLMRRMAMDYALTQDGKRKTWQDYMNELNSGINIPVQGFALTGVLWNEAAACKLYLPGQGDNASDQRPYRQVKLDRSAAPLIAGIGQWRALNPALRIGYVPLNPDLSPLFEENLQWIVKSLLPSESLGQEKGAS